MSPLHECTIKMDIMFDWGTHSLSRIVHVKQHKIPDRWKEILTLIDDILEIPVNVLYHCSEWPVKKTAYGHEQ